MAVKFEDALTELEMTVKQLENGNTTLEEAMALFEKGVSLTKECQKLLKEAELKVTKLLEDGSEEPFEASRDE